MVSFDLIVEPSDQVKKDVADDALSFNLTFEHVTLFQATFRCKATFFQATFQTYSTLFSLFHYLWIFVQLKSRS